MCVQEDFFGLGDFVIRDGHLCLLGLLGEHSLVASESC